MGNHQRQPHDALLPLALLRLRLHLDKRDLPGQKAAARPYLNRRNARAALENPPQARRTDAPRRDAHLRRRRALPRKPRPSGDETPRRNRRHDDRPRYNEGIRRARDAAHGGILRTIAGRDNSDNRRDAHRQDRARAAADGKI